MTTPWDIAPRSLIEFDLRFTGNYCCHHQADDSVNTSERPVNFYETKCAISQKDVIFVKMIICTET
jgi:hypothetical protein